MLLAVDLCPRFARGPSEVACPRIGARRLGLCAAGRIACHRRRARAGSACRGSRVRCRACRRHPRKSVSHAGDPYGFWSRTSASPKHCRHGGLLSYTRRPCGIAMFDAYEDHHEPFASRPEATLPHAAPRAAGARIGDGPAARLWRRLICWLRQAQGQGGAHHGRGQRHRARGGACVRARRRRHSHFLPRRGFGCSADLPRH